MSVPDPVQPGADRTLTGEPDERVVRFACRGDELLGILTGGAPAAKRGVLVIVGGPQYRAGSHRQFTLLARRLASAGYPVFRFDYRGMGDSEGAQREFDTVGDDIAAAISAFHREWPGLDGIVLWALCDGGSAAMMYAAGDPRVKGLVVLNPWVRSATTLARAHVRMYYPRRLLQRAFWAKLGRGELRIGESLRNFAASVRRARGDDAPVADYMVRMRDGLAGFRGPTLLVLSGNDLVARELLETAARDARWRAAIDSPAVSRASVPDADHTFSRAAWRDAVERITLEWLAKW